MVNNGKFIYRYFRYGQRTRTDCDNVYWHLIVSWFLMIILDRITYVREIIGAK